ncbi:unnamed protein product [Blepharisma stoltei]|uniref:Protein kinase domain-containing protein n=1 Tax=Blepharisma stoltei TaxID=1481888 RepID=A0AAU9IMQ8_9CILI|nr:unnamed protein product [Blepharisma stoltei]
MDLFNSIVDYLESRHLLKSASMLRGIIKSISFDDHLTDREKNLLRKIESSLGNKENKAGVSQENEAIMENLMTRLISNPKIAQSKAVENNLERLFEVKAFQKMVSCADQLFFDSDSMNISSKIVHNNDKDASSGSIASSLHESQDQSESYRTSQEYSSDKPGNSEIDEYEDDDDPGYEAYECSEEDFEEISRQLGDKYGFPARAAYPKKNENKEERREPIKPQFPPHIKFPKSGDSFYPKEFDGVVYDCYDLKVITDRERTGFEENKEFPIVVDSVIAGRYKVIEFLGSAAFSKAIQCLDTFTDEMVCLKIIENNKDYIDQSIDEIKLLLYIKENGDADEHNVLRIIDYFYHKEHLFIVTELLRDNLYEFYRYNREHEDEFYFTMGHLQRITVQILKGLEFLHSLLLIHCDLKPENVLIKSYSRCLVKIIDLGSSCYIHDHLSSYVQSRSYRAPEVIMGCTYDYRIDIWSLGCILAELWTGNVLFQNDSVQGLLARVVGIVGPFPDYMFKHGRHVGNYFTREKLIYQVSDEKVEDSSSNLGGKKIMIFVPKKTSLKARLRADDDMFVDFIASLLELDKEKRPTASQALQHPWLTQCKYPDGLP